MKNEINEETYYELIGMGFNLDEKGEESWL